MIEAFYQLIAAMPDVMQAIDGRLHYERRVQGQDGPAIVLQRGSLSGQLNHGGPSAFMTGFVRINVIAPTYLACEDIARLLRGHLDGYRGTADLADRTLRIAFITLDDESDIPSEISEGASAPAPESSPGTDPGSSPGVE